jgi:PTH1 family peptidyl-tRNA hydrolase
MKLLVGLGNPEGRYAKTRHNAGFMVIDRLLGKFAGGEALKARFNSACAEASVAGERVLFMKPTTYMNRSGQAVGEAVRFFKINASGDLLVITDDIYLPVGVIRLKPGGGTGGHNGLEDIHRALGTDAYPRLRVGVGMKPNGGKPAYMDQADFVLQGVPDEDQGELNASLDKAAQACETFITKGLPAAMNASNSKLESGN